MHRNPVKEGLAQEPELWPWSSHRTYASGKPGLVKIDQWPKAELRLSPDSHFPLSSPNAPTPVVVPTYTLPLMISGVINLFPAPN